MDDKALQNFRSVCEREFQFLVDDFGFTSLPLPDGEHANQFQFRLSNGALRLIVYSMSYGRSAWVCLEDKHGHGRSVPVWCLAPEWEPFGFSKLKKEKKNNLNLEQQIIQAAQMLRNHGADILSGDIERFNKISDQINGLMR